MKEDHRVMEDQLMQEASILLNPPRPAADPDAPEAEIVDDPPDEAA